MSAGAVAAARRGRHPCRRCGALTMAHRTYCVPCRLAIARAIARARPARYEVCNRCEAPIRFITMRHGQHRPLDAGGGFHEC